MKKQDPTIIRAMELLRTNWIHSVHLLREAADKHPKEPSYQIALGDVFYSRGSHDKALQHYLIALSMDPSDQQSIAMIANCYLYTGEYRLALAYFQKILNPTDDVLYNTAVAQAFLGKHDDCIATLKSILPRFPNHPFVYFMLVEQYYYLRNYEEAMRYIHLAKQYAGIHYQLYLLSAVIYFEKEHYLLAYENFRMASEFNIIANTEQLISYARSAREAGLYKEAIRIFEDITKRYPQLSDAWVELIKLHIDLGNFNEARKNLALAKAKLSRTSSIFRVLQERLKEQE